MVCSSLYATLTFVLLRQSPIIENEIIIDISKPHSYHWRMCYLPFLVIYGRIHRFWACFTYLSTFRSSLFISVMASHVKQDRVILNICNYKLRQRGRNGWKVHGQRHCIALNHADEVRQATGKYLSEYKFSYTKRPGNLSVGFKVLLLRH
jgi:hypothetical protein